VLREALASAGAKTSPSLRRRAARPDGGTPPPLDRARWRRWGGRDPRALVRPSRRSSHTRASRHLPVLRSVSRWDTQVEDLGRVRAELTAARLRQRQGRA
jgi:hypothetical protein